MIIQKDGVRYEEWKPKNEITEFEPMIIHHIKDIFGEGCEFFPKKEIEAIPGIKRTPDGYVIDFENERWFIIELKLLGDDAIERITTQINDYEEIRKRDQLSIISDSIKGQIGVNGKKPLVSDIIFRKSPQIIVIINSLDGKKGEQFKRRAKRADKIIEFKTFMRKGVDPKKSHIHLFEPIYKIGKEIKEVKKVTVSKAAEKRYYKRKEFWKQLIEYSKTKTNLLANRSPTTEYWLSTKSGKSGIHFLYMILQDESLISLNIEKKDKKQNKRIFNQLIKEKKVIEGKFGKSLNWDRMEGKKSFKITYSLGPGGLTDRHKWPKIQYRMINTMHKFRNAFEDSIIKLKI